MSARGALVAAAMVSLTACGGNARGGAAHRGAEHPVSRRSRVTIENRSHWAIRQLYLTPFDTKDWGEGQLSATERIGTGQSLEIRGIECDSYAVKLVDEAGDEGILQDVHLCSEYAK